MERKARARAKAGGYHSPIYTASHDAQEGRWKEVHLGDRTRGAKIGPSERGGGGEGE
jgi:hypothetical protein